MFLSSAEMELLLTLTTLLPHQPELITLDFSTQLPSEPSLLTLDLFYKKTTELMEKESCSQT